MSLNNPNAVGEGRLSLSRTCIGDSFTTGTFCLPATTSCIARTTKNKCTSTYKTNKNVREYKGEEVESLTLSKTSAKISTPGFRVVGLEREGPWGRPYGPLNSVWWLTFSSEAFSFSISWAVDLLNDAYHEWREPGYHMQLKIHDPDPLHPLYLRTTSGGADLKYPNSHVPTEFFDKRWHSAVPVYGSDLESRMTQRRPG